MSYNSFGKMEAREVGEKKRDVGKKPYSHLL